MKTGSLVYFKFAKKWGIALHEVRHSSSFRQPIERFVFFLSDGNVMPLPGPEVVEE